MPDKTTAPEAASDADAPSASKTDPDEAQVDAATGMLLPNRKIAGGAIREVLETDPAPEVPKRDVPAMFARAAASAVSQKAGAAIGRPVTEWGLLGKGDVIHSSMTLVDLDTGEKVEVAGGSPTTLKDDRLYANARNFPQMLVEGATLEDLVGGVKHKAEDKDLEAEDKTAAVVPKAATSRK